MSVKDSRTLVYDATGGSDIFRRLAATGKYDEGALYKTTFKDGEIYHRLDTPVRNRRVILVGDVSDNAKIMATYDVANALFDEGARELTIVLPADSMPANKACRDGINDLLASVPTTRLGNKLVLVPNGLVGTPEYSGRKIVTKRRKASHETAFDLFGSTSPTVVFSTASYDYLADEMLAHGQFERGDAARTDSGGKPFFHKLATDVRGRDVVLVTGTIDDDETMELYYMSRAIVDAGALSLTIVVSYYGYGTMERKVKAGEAVKAKIRARLLSCIPASRLGNRAIFVDLHSEGIPYYVEGGLQPQHVYVAKHLVSAVAKEMKCGVTVDGALGAVDPEVGGDAPVLCSTDAGRSKWVESMARDAKLPAAFALKERVSADKTEPLGVLGDVFGKSALVYDDKLGTGGTAENACSGVRNGQYGQDVVKAARAGSPCQDAPVCEMQLVCTHYASPPAVARERLRNAKDLLGRSLVQRIVVSNSNPRALRDADGEFLVVKSIAYLLAQAVIAA